jgi:hypothetical protein
MICLNEECGMRNEEWSAMPIDECGIWNEEFGMVACGDVQLRI